MALLQITEPGQSKDNQESAEMIIGIDLGTTNSLVAVVREGKVEILKDEDGKDVIASVVEYDEVGNVLSVGKNGVASVKRMMGQGEDVVVGSKRIRPEEVSAEILKYLKKIAEKAVNTAIQKAVITVPAYFDEGAKNATKVAAQLAGLEVVRLVNEPTAAALAYGLENKSEGVYLVYDLGGGTFDASVLKMQGGVFKVLGVAGDNCLGGDDFDDLVAKKLGVGKAEARAIKEKLSFDEEKIFTREDFEKLISEKILKTITLTTDLLDDLELQPEKIKGVILVGGSTRIPLIHKKLAEIFGEKKILTNLDPDRVVAIGAAWQAYNLMGHGDSLLLDVNPLSLGIEMMGGIVEKIIQRNSAIPTAYAKEFTTYAANQTGMKFHIVQGERELAANCRSLANFEIKGIPPMPAGMARVLVTFRLDADGLLTVSAEEKTTETKQEIEVKPSYHLDQNQVKSMLLDSLKNSKTDIENRLLIEAATEALQDVVIIENDLKNDDNFLDQNEKKIIAEKLKELQKAIKEKNSREEIIAAQQELARVSEDLVLRKVNNVLKEKISGKKIDEV